MSGYAKILIVSVDPRIITNLPENKWTFAFKVKIVPSSFEAGIEMHSFRPDCVIVDFAIGIPEFKAIGKNIRSIPGFKDVVLIGLLPDIRIDLDKLAFNDVFSKPVDFALLMKRVKTLVDERS